MPCSARIVTVSFLATAWLVISVGLVSAAERPVVSVSFELAVARYTWDFPPEQLPEVQNRVAAGLARRLSQSERFPGLQFLAFRGPGDAGSARVHIVLEPGTVKLDEEHVQTVLRLEVSGAGLRAVDAHPIEFRSAERYNARIVDKALGLEPFMNDLASALARDAPELYTIFSSIPVAQNDGLFLPGYHWVLPFKRKDSCFSDSSTLLIVNEAQAGEGPFDASIRVRPSGSFSGGAPAQQKFKDCIQGFPEENQPDLNRLRAMRPARVQVRAIYVLKHVPMPRCPGLVDPRDTP